MRDESMSLETDLRLSKGMKKFIFASLVIHVLAAGVAYLLGAGFITDLFWKNKELTTINSSVRVDVVAMPKLTLKELEELDTPPEVDPNKAVSQDSASAPDESAASKTTPDPSEEVLLQDKNAKRDIKDLLKNLSQKKVATKAAKTPPTGNFDFSKLSSDKLKQLIVAGNKVGQGASLTGESSGGPDDGYVVYLHKIKNKVLVNWNLPQGLFELQDKLTCRVRLYVSSSGNLLKLAVVQSSGNAQFDEKVIDSIKKSAPFDPPSEQYRTRALNGEILLGFPK